MSTTVEDLLRTKPRLVASIRPERSLRDAAAELESYRVGALVVCDEPDHVIGILSERDIVRAVAMYGERAMARSVSEVMSKDVHTCDPRRSIDELLLIMTARRIRHLPVVSLGRLCGIISMGDLVVRVMRERGSAQQAPAHH